MADAADSTNIIKEGRAEIICPKGTVFYNQVQEFNRDLTIAVISQYAQEHFNNLRERKLKKGNKKKDDSENPVSETGNSNAAGNDPQESIHLEPGKKYEDGIRIFEGLSASGLRSIRFGLEIPGIQEVVANDIKQHSVDVIRENIKRHKLEDLVRGNQGDAALAMYLSKANGKRFHVIDLDPYGTAAPFLDAAVQSVADGGLLCVTCTDAAVLCGNACETSWAKYGSMSLKAKFCHEMALRILLQSIESHANRYERYIVPLISVSADFYFRVFVKVFTSQLRVKLSCTKMAQVFHCVGCGSFELQPIATKIPTKGDNYKFQPATAPVVGQMCEHCGFRKVVGGPVWAEPLYDRDFVRDVMHSVQGGSLATAKRIEGMLTVMEEELPASPLYYVMDHLCCVLHCVPLSLVQMRSAILNAGYSVSLSHAAKNSIKTDAPGQVVWDIMRSWVQQNPVRPGRLGEGTPAKAILETAPSTQISFQLHPDANPPSRQQKLLRWQVNPTRDWGPKARAKRTATDQSDRRAANQGKRLRSKKDGEEEEKEMETTDTTPE